MSIYSEECLARMEALVRKMYHRYNNVSGDIQPSEILPFMSEAAAIFPELPVPVDPDRIEARTIAGDTLAAWSNGTQRYSSGHINAVRSGAQDDDIAVVSALAGIKRERDLARQRELGRGILS